MLTKSLHTVTAATNVARHLIETGFTGAGTDEPGECLAIAALAILGYDGCVPVGSDPTVDRICAACERMLTQLATGTLRAAPLSRWPLVGLAQRQAE
jgi:hypothetical protein